MCRSELGEHFNNCPNSAQNMPKPIIKPLFENNVPKNPVVRHLFPYERVHSFGHPPSFFCPPLISSEMVPSEESRANHFQQGSTEIPRISHWNQPPSFIDEVMNQSTIYIYHHLSTNNGYIMAIYIIYCIYIYMIIISCACHGDLASWVSPGSRNRRNGWIGSSLLHPVGSRRNLC